MIFTLLLASMSLSFIGAHQTKADQKTIEEGRLRQKQATQNPRWNSVFD